MNFISQMLFQDLVQILFIVGSTLPLFHSLGVSQQFRWCFSSIAEEFSFKSCPFSRRFAVLASCYPIKLFHLSDILFLPIRSMSEVVFPFLFTGGHHSSYHFLIIPVLRSSVLQSAHDLFVLLHLNPL